MPRARTTAEIIADVLNARELLETSNVLQTGSSAATVHRWLRERTEERLMIVGHNPTLSDLVSLLVLGSTATADLRPEERGHRGPHADGARQGSVRPQLAGATQAVSGAYG